VSSPIATGGAGTAFEQHVGAYWLAQLLVSALPPILISGTVAEVCFQTERLGWHTDDFMIDCTVGRLVGQVKRQFTVSAADEECVMAITDFWNDFSGSLFAADADRLVLVTLRGTNRLLGDFAALLDSARSSRDGEDFAQRLATPGLLSQSALRDYGQLEAIVETVVGRSVAPTEMWPFLRVLHVLSLDLTTQTRQAETHVKTMLAFTVESGDAVASAAASWNELVAEASTAMIGSRCVRRSDLPTATVARHGIIDGDRRRMLRRLADHTAPVLDAIRTELGSGFHLDRAGLVQQVLTALEATQIVVVTGPAGSGKSAAAKGALSALAQSHFIVAFRAEELATAHIDTTLAAAQIHSSWESVRAVLGAQDRKVVLVESVERLLEHTTRDAFTDLLVQVAKDPSLRVVLTCRDYSVDQVRASFLQANHITPTVVRVPPLDDGELTQVEVAFPTISPALRSPVMRKILRNPFILDRALAIDWSPERSLPATEHEFRSLFWREIVRGGARVTARLAPQRESALQTIAIRRAQALVPHVPIGDLDAVAVESLRSDSLVASPENNLLVVAPAHDVLEDWAILQWIEGQHLARAPLSAISAAIGPFPAVRRSFRRWVAELVERDASAADQLFQEALADTTISPQFRDDTLIALLKAPLAPEFLRRNEQLVVVGGHSTLKRIVFLLRVACMATPDWLPAALAAGSLFSVPEGVAWAPVVEIVHRHLAAFADEEGGLLLGLIEDAVRGIDWRNPVVDGATEIVGIAHWLLATALGYGESEVRKRVLKVLAKLPNVDAGRFEQVLRGAPSEHGRRDNAAEDLQELIYAGVDGMPASRDLPQVVVTVGAEYLLASDADIDVERRHGNTPLDVDLYFGVKEGLQSVSYPASAHRGPWMHLLRTHPDVALAFYVEVFEHSGEWYARPRLPNPLEPAWEVTITFADDSERVQWANGRLWYLYRGMSVGPYALQSMLMALESWLLEMGKSFPDELDNILVNLLRRSGNAAIASVVASVAIAYPQVTPEALLTLLSARDYIVLDRLRMASESQTSLTENMLPMGLADHQVYQLERKQSNALPHRQRDLESAIMDLQLTGYAPRVQTLLDQHSGALPPNDQQDDDDRLWRIALHRMDLRQYSVSEEQLPEAMSEELSPRYVQLDPLPLEPDVQALVDEGRSHIAAQSSRFALLMWGVHAFRRNTSKYDPSQWEARLAEATAMDRQAGQSDGTSHAPGFIAAVCLRDRWDDMSPAGREWCVDTVCSEVMRHATFASDHGERYQRNALAADRPTAFVLVTALGKTLTAAQRERISAAFAAAITHPVEEVQNFAIWSIDEDTWANNSTLGLRCVNALATQAALIDSAHDEEARRPYRERQDSTAIAEEAATFVREQFWVDGGIDEDAHLRLDTSDRFGAFALRRILTLFSRVPNDPLAVAEFTRASHALAGWWSVNDDRRGSSNRNYHLEGDVSDQIQSFVFRTSPGAAGQVLAPLLAQVDRHSRDVATIMQGLTGLQDSNSNVQHYWFLWQLVADATKHATWVARLTSDRHRDGTELLAAVFLTQHWKADARHWSALEGNDHFIHDLFEAMPASAVVLDDYGSFLYHVGGQSLPRAFVLLAKALQRGDPEKMLMQSNTVYVLEVLLQRHVYGRPFALKQDPAIRDAALVILDCLVDVGSSAAFRMRDDFVTPAAA
jgi:hypothetical protein